MNSILTHKIISTKYSFAQRKWFYNFRALNKYSCEKNYVKISRKLTMRYTKIAKKWTPEINSEWLCRIYFSAKMILSATLNLNAAAYAQKKNLRMVVPYLRYYALLSLSRGLIYSLPETDWNNGEIFQSSHAKTKKLAATYIANLDKNISLTFKTMFSELKAGRELISYRAPSSGDEGIDNQNRLNWMFVFLAEMIQFNSEIMETSILKHSDDSCHTFLLSYITLLSKVQLDDHSFFDMEDNYRLSYLSRKYPCPPNILHIMTEGHVEDFFGAWGPEDETNGDFDPDMNWQKIFNIP